MQVQTVEPDVTTAQLLAGAQFSDAFSVVVDGTALDARHAAMRMFERDPPWLTALYRLRNLLVAPFGLKTSGAKERSTGGMIGLFPVLIIVFSLIQSWLDHRKHARQDAAKRRESAVEWKGGW